MVYWGLLHLAHQPSCLANLDDVTEVGVWLKSRLLATEATNLSAVRVRQLAPAVCTQKQARPHAWVEVGYLASHAAQYPKTTRGFLIRKRRTSTWMGARSIQFAEVCVFEEILISQWTSLLFLAHLGDSFSMYEKSSVIMCELTASHVMDHWSTVLLCLMMWDMVEIWQLCFHEQGDKLSCPKRLQPCSTAAKDNVFRFISPLVYQCFWYNWALSVLHATHFIYGSASVGCISNFVSPRYCSPGESHGMDLELFASH